MSILHFLGIKKYKIGFALSSGIIKGFAHIGVLKVLKENNIPISYMSGTSAGALVGGLYLSNNQSIEKLEKIVEEFGTLELAKLFADFSLKGGIVSGNKIKEFLNDLLGKINIEDLPIPFAVVATNLKTGIPTIFKKGNLAEAIRASFSIQLIFEPAKIGDNYYIDGASTMPIPIKPLKEMGADKIIASCLDFELLPLEITKDNKIIVNPIERAFSLMYRDITLRESKDADIVICPDFKSLVDPTKFNNYSKRKEIISLGEIAALKHIEKIKTL